MTKVKIFGIFIIGFLLIGLAGANGLSIAFNSSFTINKTYNHDVYVDISIRNDEPWSFFNVSFEDNSYIFINKISEIHSGEIRTVTALIKANEDINSEFKIYGFYLASLGARNQTHEININYENGLDKCDFSIVKGDSILWKNIESAQYPTKVVKLKNSDTGEYFKELAVNTSSLQKFDIPLILNFQFIDRTGGIRQACTLTVLADTGYVNNPEYDASIFLNVDVKFPDTNLELFTLNTNYQMKFYDTKEDIFSIKNVGIETAKDIHLSGDWFSFSVNNFDLEPGESKNIGYVIDPKIYNSNETNKNYTKNISISGNFLRIEREFIIFIEYAEFVDAETDNVLTLKDYICENFPEFCEPQIVYKYISDGEYEFNVTTSQDRINSLYDLFFDYMDEQVIKDKQRLQQNDEIDSKLKLIENSTTGTGEKIESLSEKLEITNGVWKATALIMAIIASSIILFAITIRYREKFKNNAWSRYG